MNKKGGTSREIIQKIGYLFLVIIVIVFIFVVVFDHLNLDINTTKQQHELIALNLINTPSCLAYEDPIIGIESGKIDPEKIKDGRLEKCLNKTRTSYRIFLYDENNNLIKKAQNMNLIMQSQLPVCEVNKDSYRCNIIKDYVLFKTNEGFKPGYFVTEVITYVQ